MVCYICQARIQELLTMTLRAEVSCALTGCHPCIQPTFSLAYRARCSPSVALAWQSTRACFCVHSTLWFHKFKNSGKMGNVLSTLSIKQGFTGETVAAQGHPTNGRAGIQVQTGFWFKPHYFFYSCLLISTMN